MAKAFEPKMCTAISAKLEALSNLKIDKKKMCMAIWKYVRRVHVELNEGSQQQEHYLPSGRKLKWNHATFRKLSQFYTENHFQNK